MKTQNIDQIDITRLFAADSARYEIGQAWGTGAKPADAAGAVIRALLSRLGE